MVAINTQFYLPDSLVHQQIWVWQGDDLPRIYSGVDILPLLGMPSLTVNAVMAMTADNNAIAPLQPFGLIALVE